MGGWANGGSRKEKMHALYFFFRVFFYEYYETKKGGFCYGYFGTD